jgi:sensor histidine kinase YesM
METILGETAESLRDGAAAVNGMFYNCEQRMRMIRQDYKIQNLLLSRQKIRMSVAVFDFYYDINTRYSVIREADPSWNMTVYTLNPNVLSGAFIENADRMPAYLRDIALGTAYGEYRWVYYKAPDQAAEKIYVLTVNSMPDGEIYAINQISMNFGRIRDAFGAEYPKGARILYYAGGVTPVDILPDPVGAPAAEFAESGAAGYYEVDVSIAANNDYVTAYVPKNYVRMQLLTPILYLTAGYVALFLMFLVLTALLSHQLSARLQGVITEMGRDIPNLLDKDYLEAFDGGDEFAAISRRFKDLVLAIGGRYSEMAEIKAENKNLELELLQSLINPHLLYNTLDGIKWTYRDGRLTEVIDNMVKYYRIALNRGDILHSVPQEIEMARVYTEIQKFAYEVDFQFVVELGADAAGCVILKNIVQPIVENAFLHGIKRRPQDLIAVSARREAENLVVTVSDNGAGMDRDKLKAVVDGTYGGVMGGYGLANVNRRIRLYYGDDYGLTVESEKGFGTTVTIRVKYGDPGEGSKK